MFHSDEKRKLFLLAQLALALGDGEAAKLDFKRRSTRFVTTAMIFSYNIR